MKPKSRVTVIMAALIGFTAVASAQTRPAVLELFTSEGCSSCPPAESYVAELAQRAGILPLTFHVNYWDSLGWKDRFALASGTARQQLYASALHHTSVYTPEAVIDGQYDYVGSNRSSIDPVLSTQRSGIAVSLVAHDEHIEVDVGPATLAHRSDVLLVGYLRQATSSISRGENSGRTIHEFNIVRSIQRLGGWDGMQQRFRIPLNSLTSDTTHVAVLVQQSNQGAIIGAASQAVR